MTEEYFIACPGQEQEEDAFYRERPVYSGGSLATYLSAHRWICHHHPRCADEPTCQATTTAMWREIDRAVAVTAASLQAAREASLAAAKREHDAIAAGVKKLRDWRTDD